MIKVIFFARIREQLAQDGLSLPYSDALGTVTALCQRLVEQHGEHWAKVLLADNVLVAVNQDLVERDHQLVDGDEVAFFPPVTGG